MTLFPRRAADVRPLSPGVEALLAGSPRVEAPDGLRTRLLAAHARREAMLQPGPFFPSWARLRAGLLSAGVTAGLSVLVFAAGKPADGNEADGNKMETRLPVPAAVARASVRLVDDTRLDPFTFDRRTFDPDGAPGEGEDGR